MLDGNECGLFMRLEKYMLSTLPRTEYGQEKTLPPKVREHINYMRQIKWVGPANVRARMLWGKRSYCRGFGILNKNRKKYKA